MASMDMWTAQKSRKIARRIVVEGDLELLTPAAFSNGDGTESIDMTLLVDAAENRPLLTGTSLAGALRDWLRGCREGVSHDRLLFGGEKRDAEGEQSPLLVEDALGEAFTVQGPNNTSLSVRSVVEIRDGVTLDPESRTALAGKLFNRELWTAKTKFVLRFELLVSRADLSDPDYLKALSDTAFAAYEQALRVALATALSGLKPDGITLGARKTRGYGQIQVREWRCKTYDLTTQSGLFAWLREGARPLAQCNGTVRKPTAAEALAVAAEDVAKRARSAFHITATFALDGSLLIRTAGSGKQTPDMVHLHARRGPGAEDPVLSGTSLAGALRARAYKIAATLGGDADALTDCVFGPQMVTGVTPRLSRLRVTEEKIEKAKTDLVQNRVSIDRFTGGARDTALFNQQPVWGTDKTTLKLNLHLDRPEAHEIGLLLLTLKDLWTGDLPLGGEAGVGRGRLAGKDAVLRYLAPAACESSGESVEKIWRLVRNEGLLKLEQGASMDLQEFVGSLKTWCEEHPAPAKTRSDHGQTTAVTEPGTAKEDA